MLLFPSVVTSQETMDQPAQDLPAESSTLVLDGEVIHFSGIPQSVVDQWGPEKLDDLRLNRLEQKLILSDYRQHVEIGVHGQVALILSPDTRMGGIYPLVEFLQHPAIQNDLLFTQSQKDSLASAFDDLTREFRLFDKAKQEMLAEAPAAWSLDRKSILDRLQQSHIRSATTIKETLLPHQTDRIRQLIARKQTREIGLTTLILFGDHSLNLSEDQKAEITNRLKRNSSQLQVQTRKLKAEVLVDLQSLLTNRQQRWCRDRIGCPLSEVQIPIGILWAQMQPLTTLSLPSPFDKWKELNALDLPNRFGFDVFHQFQTPTIDESSTSLYYVCHSLSALLGGQRMPPQLKMDFTKELELTEEQLIEVRRMYPVIYRTMADNSSNQPPILSEAQLDQQRARREEIFEQIIDQHFELLTTTQVERLNMFLERIKLRRVGHLNLLLHDPEWIRGLDLSQSQIARLKSKADKIRKQLVDESLRIKEEFVQQNLLAVLTLEQRKQLDQTLGDAPVNVMSNLDLLIEACDPDTMEGHFSFQKADLERAWQWDQKNSTQPKE